MSAIYCTFVWMHHGRPLGSRYSGFMKDFVSFTMKIIHLFDVSSSIETDLFLFKLAICEFLSVKFSKTQKELLQTYLLISFSQCTLKTLVHIISLVLSRAQVRSISNGTEKTALLDLKIWYSILLAISKKKHVNVF